ncbi:MAG: cytochrome c oxidase subunit 3 [Saprospiraceae bacterium]|nr:cytochrome c oxidase subunit 3 [Saprospiraceae bacterium]MBP6568153.1 cytochrome c oxidase subunit 3 [Saprospiraceae bacterium]
MSTTELFQYIVVIPKIHAKMVPRRNYLLHPYYIIITLVIAGITALFLGFTGAYIYNRVQQGVAPVHIPPLFYFNSILIVASSITLIYAKKRYESDDTPMFKVALWLTLLLTIFFLIMQIQAWHQLYAANISLTSSTLASYMYLISGLHFLHLVAGIPFLMYFIYSSHMRMKDPVTVLIYFSDPDKKRELNLLNIYWHFLDGLWIYLILFFLINYMI